MRKWLSFLMALAMLSTSVLGGALPALAEEDLPNAAYGNGDGSDGGSEEEYLFESVAQLPAMALPAGFEMIEPDFGNVEDADAQNVAAANESGLWYVRAKADAEIKTDADVAATVPAGSVMLAYGRNGGALKVAFNTDKGVVYGTVDIAAVEDMTEAQVDAFMDEIALSDGVVLYNDMIDYPLPETQCSFIAAQTAVETDSEDANDDPDNDNGEDPEDEDNADEQSGDEQNDNTDAEEHNGDSEIDETADGDATSDEQDSLTDDGAQADEQSDADDFVDADDHVDMPVEDIELMQLPMMSMNMLGVSAVQSVEDDEPEDDASVDMTPVAIDTTYDEITIGIQERFEQLGAVAVTADGADVDGVALTWRSSNAAIAAVDAQTGVVTGVRAGTAYVYVSAEDLPEATVKVTVGTAPTAVAVTPNAITLGADGMSYKLNPFVNKGAASGSYTYVSSNEEVAVVDEDGNVVSVGPGVARITITTYNGRACVCTVTVTDAPAQIELTATEMTIGVGQTAQIGYAVKDADGVAVNANVDAVVADDVGNPGCVAFDPATGTVTALSQGTSVIEFETHNMVSASCIVHVVAAPADIELNYDTIVIGYREYFSGLAVNLIPPEGEDDCEASLTWSCSNTYYVAFNQEGHVYGTRVGWANVTVTTQNGLSKTVRVQVANAPTRVYIAPAAVTMGAEGMTQQLTVAVNTGAATGVYTYKSSNPDVASVDENGLVTAHAKGVATISATAYNGKYAVCTVTVTGAPENVTLEPAELEVAVGQTGKLSASAVDSDGALAAAQFNYFIDESQSPNPGCVSINSATGEVTGLSKGSAVIGVETHNDVTDYCMVHVVSAPAAIELNHETLEIGYHEYYSGLEVTLTPPEGEERCAAVLTWSCANTYYVAFNQEGHVYGTRVGWADVTVTAHNGLSKTVRVFVRNAPTRVYVAPAAMNLSDGMTQQLAVAVNTGAATGVYTYWSGNPDVATIDENGLVTGVSTGSTYVYAKAYNGKYAWCLVKVTGNPATLEPTREDIDIAVEQTDTVAAKVYDAAGVETVTNYTYTIDASSPNSDCITLDEQTGAVVGISKGEAVVRITAHNGVTNTCTVHVVSAPATIELNHETLEIGYHEYYSGLEVTLTPPEGEERCAAVLTWSCANTYYVAFNQEGHVYGTRVGWADVTVTAHNGLSKTVRVFVRNAPTRVYVAPAAMNLSDGMTQQLAVAVNTGAATGVYTYWSANPDVATIDENGLVTGVSTGSTYVYAKAYNGKYAWCLVKVTGNPATLEPTREDIDIAVEQTDTVAAKVYDAAGVETVTNYTYTIDASSPNSDCITLDEQTGAVVGVSKGEAVVRITAHNGVTNTCTVHVVSAPAAIELNHETLEIGYHEYYSGLEVTLTPPEGEERCAAVLTWSCANTYYVAFNQEGHVYGTRVGWADVTVTTHNGLSKTVRVFVRNAPTRVYVAPAAMNLSDGMTQQLAVAVNTGAATGVYTYWSANPDVATIDENGLVTGVSTGSTYVYAKAYNGKYAWCLVKVTGNPATLEPTREDIDIAVEQTDTVAAKVYDAAGVETVTNYTYTIDASSPNPDCITLDEQTGAVVGVSKGEAVVRITAHNGVTNTCTVHVVSAPAAIELNHETLEIGYHEYYSGLEVTLTPPEGEERCAAVLTWSCANTYYVAFNQEGHVYGTRVGWADVTVTAHNGLSKTVRVFVRNAPTRVYVAPATMNLSDGMTQQLAVAVNTGAATGVYTYWSANPDVATIDENGLVTGVSTGSTYVYAKAYNGKYAWCLVKVTGDPATLEPTREDIDIAVEQTDTVSAKVYDAAGVETVTNYTYTIDASSPNPSCITLDEQTGAVVGVSKGEAVVRITAHNGVTNTCTVHVVSAPAAIEMNHETLEIGYHEYYSGLEVTLTPPEGEERCAAVLTWSCANTYYVAFNQEGHVYGTRVGWADVTVTTHNGLSKTVRVFVRNAPTRVYVAPAAMNLSDGMTQQLAVAVNTGAATGVYTYWSANPDVATIDENGLVTGVSTGSTYVYAKAYNGKYAWCLVKVTGNPATLEPTREDIDIAVEQNDTVAAKVYDAAGAETVTNYTFTIDPSSPNPSCITLDEQTGAVVGVSKGEAVVRITAHNGVTNTCTVHVVSAPAAIELNHETLEIGYHEYFSGLEVTLTPPEGEERCAAVLTWSCANTYYVAFNQEGHVYGTRVGWADVTVTTHNGLSKTVRVFVRNAPTRVYVAPAAMNLSDGMTQQLAVAVNTGAATGVYTYWSGNPDVATIDENGLVTGVSTGSTYVYAKAYNGQYAACLVKVTAAPASIELNADSVDIIAAQTATLVPSVKDADGKATVSSYTYAVDAGSANPACVEISEAGVVTGLSKGQAIITVTAHNGISTSCTVNVEAAPADVKLNHETLEIGYREYYSGLDFALIPPEGSDTCDAVVTWRTSNAKIVAINQDGDIYGSALGTAVVSVTTHNGIETSVTVTVKAAPAALTITPAQLPMTVGMTAQVIASANGNTASGAYTYTSSDESIATVSEDGTVTAVAMGTATITAQAFNGAKGTCAVTVYEAPDQVFITESMTVAEDFTGDKLVANVVDVDGGESFANYTFTAADGTGSVSVSNDGAVTGVTAGTAYVKVTTHNGVSTHIDAESGERVETVCEVTVLAAPAEIHIACEDAAIEVADIIDLAPVVYDIDGKAFDLVKPEIIIDGDAVTVSEDGVVTGVKGGEAVIEFRTYNGISASCVVTVKPHYKLFAAYSYFDPSVSGALYFTENNAKSVQKVLATTTIYGAEYEMVGMMKNPSKSGVLNGIRGAFADNTDYDVSVVYLCSHGHMYIDIDVATYQRTHSNRLPASHYGLSLPGYSGWNSSSNYFITAEEIFSAIQSIKGTVVLVLDSCYSGEFITRMQGALDAEGGRISVLTAASNTNASYYNIKNTSEASDFFTYFLLLGMGYNMGNVRESIGFTNDLRADTNGDGNVSVLEAFTFAKNSVTANMASYSRYSWFYGNVAQVPRIYVGNNADLVLYANS